MRLLTAKQVADILQITQARVYEMSRESLLPTVRLGRQVRYDEDSLKEWIKAGGSSLSDDNNRNGEELTGRS